MSRRSGLGRGLGALIPSELVHDETATFRELPIAAIEPNRFQPREHFDDETLTSLADSIRELGVLQPVLVRPLGEDQFELIAGERRWRAARRAGLTSIPALVRDVTDTGSLEQALVENLHRADLNALEEAAAYQQLVEDFGLTQEQVATRVGKSRSAVTNTLRLLHLPAPVQRLVAEQRVSAGHARALLGTPDRTFQESLAQRVVREGWTVRQTEEAVRLHLLVEDEGADDSSPGTARGQTPGVSDGAAPTRTETRSTSGALEPASPAPSPGAIEGTDRLGAGSPPRRVLGPDRPGPSPVDRPLPAAGLLELEHVLSEHFATPVHVSLGRGKGRITIDFADVEDLERIYRLIVQEP